MTVGESKVREEIQNCISMHAVFGDVSILKKNKINLISSNG
jgi:hypothetical protein